MGLFSTLVGGAFGVTAHMYANAIKKIPLSRQPWMYVTMFTVGCYVGNKYPKAEKALVERINERRAENGLPPLVGTTAWIRYQPAQIEDVKK